MVFPLICVHASEDTGYIENTELNNVNKTYFELLLELYLRRSKTDKHLRAWMFLWKRRVREMKETMVRLFGDHSEC